MRSTPPGDAGSVDDDDETLRQQLSVVRVAVLLLVLALIGGGVYLGARNVLASATPLAKPWFAPYVDATLTPTYQFQDPGTDVAQNIVLGFVVSSSTERCTPAWGGAYTLDAAETSLNLDRRIVQFRRSGGSVTASFGGGGTGDLAESCTTPAALAAAYLEVIQRYGLRTIDLDDETAAALRPDVVARRAAAVAELESRLQHAGIHLAVWLTLPAGPDGLGAPERAEVSAMVAHHVALAGVNSLDEDFGDDRYPVAKMLPAVETSLRDTHGQLAAIYDDHHHAMGSRAVWAHMGSTVEIGQNDVKKETFGLYDAGLLVSFANTNGLGRISMWSLNRDSQCGSQFAVVGEISDHCSGVAQGNLQFSSIFLRLHGKAPVFSVRGSDVVTSSPSHFPYPVWAAGEAYPGGYLVVWRGEVYAAKYFTQGDAPDTPVQYAYESPWELLGPVLTTDHAVTLTTLKAGTYPAWTATVSYPEGTRVLYHGLPFISKFYNLGSSPGAVDVDPQYSPWQPLYEVPNEP